MKDDGTSPYVVFRKSMEKFQSNHNHLEVIRVSESHPCYLNRQIVLLLSALGLPTETLEALQRRYVEHTNQLRQTNAAVFLRTHSHQKNPMIRQLCTLLDEEAFSKRRRLYYDPFIVGLLDSVLKKVKSDAIKRGRIGLENGRSLMGVLDETGTLNYGEVFFQLRDGKSPPDGTLVCVTKSPCLHPGDIRLLRLKYVAALSHLVDCVCFPAKGFRPHPNECSGSDLDGDIYFVCWETSITERIVPVPPMSYVSAEPKFLERVRIEDVQNSFVNFMKTSRLGQIANAWVAWADQKGAKSWQCLQLAELHSRAVDSPKTGEVVAFPSELQPKVYPDYMGKLLKYRYQSTSALGVLHHQASNWKAPCQSLHHTKDFSFSAANYQKYVPSAKEAYKDYVAKVSHLIDKHLSKDEYELWTSPDQKVHDDISLLMQEFHDRFEKPEPSNEAEWRDKSYAWYLASTYVEEGLRPLGGSFPWVVGDHLIKNCR